MAEAVVSAAGLRKSYGEVRVLDGLDFAAAPSTLTVILGPSGSGKSTLLNLLGLMDRPDAGELRFDGRPVRGIDERGRAGLRNARVGFVFQFDSLLPEFTALENALMPALLSERPRRSDDAVAFASELLASFGLSGLADRFPHQMSGGERQRVALCRALINRPSLILADEPTGNLDKENGELVFKDLRRLADTRGAAVVMVTHNEAACQFSDRVLMMRDGRLTDHPRTNEPRSMRDR